MAADDTTPLLGSGKATRVPRGIVSTTSKILFAGFIISISLSFTQVPILYAFRIMECDQFYKDHPPFTGAGDRCARNEVDGGTAAQVSLLGLTTTFCGVINLFVAGWQIKKLGPKAALAVQTLAPAVRVAIQAVGVMVGARAGIVLIQTSQLINIWGGPSGYLLALNTAAGEVTPPLQRTAVFGQLQGSVMLGTAVGYLLGGIVGDTFGIGKPFQTASVLFAASCLYVVAAVPHIPMAVDAGQGRRSKTLEALFGSLKVLAPQRLVTAQGTSLRHRGILFLALGVFMGVLATGYAPLLILMYATAAFDFHPTENGYLISMNSLIRGVALLFLFPKLIDRGRAWYADAAGGDATAAAAATAELPTHPADFDVGAGVLVEQEPVASPPAVDATAGQAFDLAFLRWSLVADGLVTASVAFATQRWHIYLAGFLLPLASGSAPASKGVITEMCPPGKQADALQVMTLIENMAMLSTLGLFGFVFSLFSDMGKAYLTFYCNAAVALLAVVVLAFSHFPPRGCTEADHGADEQDTESEASE